VGLRYEQNWRSGRGGRSFDFPRSFHLLQPFSEGLQFHFGQGVYGSPWRGASFFELDFAIVGTVLREVVRHFLAHYAQVGSEFSWDTGQGVVGGDCRYVPDYSGVSVVCHPFVPSKSELPLLVSCAGFLASGTVESYFLGLPDSLRGVLRYPPVG